MEKITDILLSKVEDENGRRYGRVFEFRSHGGPEHGIESENRLIDAFLCGTFGLMQELGFKPSNVTTVEWDRVIDISESRILIRPPGADTTRSFD